MDYVKKLIKRALSKVRKFRKKTSNLNAFLVCVAVVLIWRWIWDLIDIYLLPDYPIISDLVWIVIWIAILLMDDGKINELEGS